MPPKSSKPRSSSAASQKSTASTASAPKTAMGKRRASSSTKTRSSTPPTTAQAREQRQTREMFEDVASDLLSGKTKAMEAMCKRLIKESAEQNQLEQEEKLSQFREKVLARVADIEQYLLGVSQRLDYVEQETGQKLQQVVEFSDKNFENVEMRFRAERAKHSGHVKNIVAKLVKGHDEEARETAAQDKREYLKLFHAVHDDVKPLARELERLREHVDDMLLKRYGFVPAANAPGDNLHASYNQGLDAGIVLDGLSNRIKQLEAMTEKENQEYDNKCNNNNNSNNKNSSNSNSSSSSSSSSSRRQHGGGDDNVNTQLLDSQMRMDDLQTQMDDCRDDIERLRKEAKEVARNTERSNAHMRSSGTEASDIKALKSKMKALGENTTVACKALSSGLSDVQQATLRLYSWSDSAREAFGQISDRLDLPSNICPQAAIHKAIDGSRSFAL